MALLAAGSAHGNYWEDSRACSGKIVIGMSRPARQWNKERFNGTEGDIVHMHDGSMSRGFYNTVLLMHLYHCILPEVNNSRFLCWSLYPTALHGGHRAVCQGVQTVVKCVYVWGRRRASDLWLPVEAET